MYTIFRGDFIMNNNLDIITDSGHEKIALVLKSLIVGIITSLVVILYRFALSYAEKIAFNIYEYISKNKWAIPLWFLILFSIAYIVGKLMDKEPYISGSGIPQIKAIMGGYIKNRPVSTIINKFIGGTLSILGGLSLGREGPSVQLGACTGDLISKFFKSSRLQRRLLISSGASAGLSAAFNAPLSGVLFCLEEIYKYFSPVVLLSTTVAAVSADFISKHFFSLNPVFNFTSTSALPLKNYWILLFLGIMLGALGSFYNWATLLTQKLYNKIKLSTSMKLLIPFALSGILGLTFPVLLCGGHAALEEFSLSNTLLLLSLVFIGKLLFSIISFGSGAPGGIFFPLLIIGGSIGSIFGYICINYFCINETYFTSFIILSMAGYFTAIVKAPITGIILITEMTGSFNHLLPLSIVSIIAYIIADLLNSAPIYDSLMENLLLKNNINEYHKHSKKKTLITNMVHYGSLIEKMSVKDINLPENTLIISINRGEISITPNGNTIIKAGDEIITMTNLKDEWKVRKFMDELTEKEYTDPME